ncbi:ABC transporter ATP-binding protein [Syntrophomonas erecta]
MLELVRVDKSFNSHGMDQQVLNDINLNVPAGDFLCILGPSGSGKTTLLRCIGGYEKITGGSIYVKGKEITSPGIDRIMVFQGFEQLFSWKTVAGNIEYPLKINKVRKEDRIKSVAYYLEMVGLTDFAHYYPHQLSGGMKQRTALARALALEPQVLLMDEPFASLDAQTRNILQHELIKLWKKTGSTILFVTHDIEEAILLSERILVISKEGRIIRIIDNNLQRPRKPSMMGFAALWDEVYQYLGNVPRRS